MDLLTNTEGKAIQAQASFELRLQGSCWKSLHDGTGWFRLHCDLLAESHPFACLGGWLVSALNHAYPRDSELARLLHSEVTSVAKLARIPVTTFGFMSFSPATAAATPLLLMAFTPFIAFITMFAERSIAKKVLSKIAH